MKRLNKIKENLKELYKITGLIFTCKVFKILKITCLNFTKAGNTINVIWMEINKYQLNTKLKFSTKETQSTQFFRKALYPKVKLE